MTDYEISEYINRSVRMSGECATMSQFYSGMFWAYKDIQGMLAGKHRDDCASLIERNQPKKKNEQQMHADILKLREALKKIRGISDIESWVSALATEALSETAHYEGE